jgi:hypothetical protein
MRPRHLLIRGLFVALCTIAASSGVVIQAQTRGAGPGRTLAAVDAPKANGCITAVTAGEHTFSCDGITYLVTIDQMCLRTACGLIFDIHGANMSAVAMRTNTNLHRLAPGRGFLVVHPSAAPTGPGTWSFTESPPKLAAFLMQMIDVFHVDRSRIHVTGFSMGAAMTHAFLCNQNRLLASVAVVTGSSVDQVMMPDGKTKCLDMIKADWTPKVPILFMNGVKDPALTPALAHARLEGLIARLGLTGGQQIAGDAHYTRKRWTGPGGMVLEFLEHDYAADGDRLGGHCMPGGAEPTATTCTKGEIAVNWGETALQWFLDHPKR